MVEVLHINYHNNCKADCPTCATTQNY